MLYPLCFALLCSFISFAQVYVLSSLVILILTSGPLSSGLAILRTFILINFSKNSLCYNPSLLVINFTDLTSMMHSPLLKLLDMNFIPIFVVGLFLTFWTLVEEYIILKIKKNLSLSQEINITFKFLYLNTV